MIIFHEGKGYKEIRTLEIFEKQETMTKNVVISEKKEKQFVIQTMYIN